MHFIELEVAKIVEWKCANMCFGKWITMNAPFHWHDIAHFPDAYKSSIKNNKNFLEVQ